MALTDTQIVELGAEITNDPASLGLTALATRADFNQIPPLLNEVRAGAAYEVAQDYISALEFLGAVDGAEYIALAAVPRQFWSDIIVAATADPRGMQISRAEIRTQLLAIWGAGTTTRANLIALQNRQGSRAEVLWGEDALVGELDVAKAIWGDDR